MIRKEVFSAIIIAACILAGCASSGKEEASDHAAYVPVNPGCEELTEEEKVVDGYLKQIKAEADALYADRAVYGIVDWGDEEVMGSELHGFCEALPKGGELHAHEMTFIPFDRYLDVIRDETAICLDEGDDYAALYAKNDPSLPERAVLLSDALGEDLITEEELRSILTLSEEDRDEGFWNVMGDSFSRTRGLATDLDLVRRIYEEEFRYACDIGLDLVELRVSCKPDDKVNTDTLTTIRDAYYNVRADHPDLRVRIIGCGGKGTKYTVGESCDALRAVIRASKEIRDEYDPADPEAFIIGLDLVNEEDTGRPLETYGEFLRSEEVTSCGLDLYLHCGESLRTDNESVIDAYLDNSRRIGHGLNLYRFPDLMEKYRERGTVLEVCPMSNLRLGYVQDLRLHPALGYLRNDIPIVIGSDDGLFMTPDPLTDDLYSAILCWDLSLGDIKAICRRSIAESGLTKEETDQLMKTWEARWDGFIAKEAAHSGN